MHPWATTFKKANGWSKQVIVVVVASLYCDVKLKIMCTPDLKILAISQ